MKKIAIVMPSYRPVPAVRGGGVEQLISSIVNENENKAKAVIDVYSIYDKKIDDYKFSYSNIIMIKKCAFLKLLEKMLNKIFKLLNINCIIDFYNNKVAKLIKNRTYDTIIIENNMFLYKKIYDNYKSQSKFIFHLHNDFGSWDKPTYLCKFISETSHSFITCSDYLTKKVIDTTKTKNVYTLSNAIDIKNFYYDDYISHKYRKKFKCDNLINYLYVGRLSENKGILKLVEYFAKFKPKTSHLFVIGDTVGESKRFINKLLNIIENANNITFLGTIDNKDVHNYISMSDVVVIPTLIEEAFGIVAIEAFACKKPVISSNSGELNNLVLDSFGYIFDKNNFFKSLELVITKIDRNNLILKGENAYKFLQESKKYRSEEYYENFIYLINK